MSQADVPSNLGGERYKKVNVLDSEHAYETLCKLLKLEAVPEVDMEPYDGNVVKYHHFMTLFKEVIESKVEDFRRRLIRFLNNTSGEARELINHCIWLPSSKGFTCGKQMLKNVYDNPHKILPSCRKEMATN